MFVVGYSHLYIIYVPHATIEDNSEYEERKYGTPTTNMGKNGPVMGNQSQLKIYNKQFV